MMEGLTLVPVWHVPEVVLWIDGAGMMTLALLPAVRHIKTPEERLKSFARVEKTFAPQARIGGTGRRAVRPLYGSCTGGVGRLGRIDYCWMDTTVAVRLFVALMLLVIEALDSRRVARRAPDADRLFPRLLRLHWMVLAGGYGYRLFDR